MRDAASVAIVVLSLVWLAAVAFGIVAGRLRLTERRSPIGRVARFCRAVFLLSP
jgi:hypothetical protein